VAPLVFVDDTFALKGGTAINLFVRDMPRCRSISIWSFPTTAAARRGAGSHQRGHPAGPLNGKRRPDAVLRSDFEVV
jgi:hypothetical protein